ncbi:MAG TPA: type II toxin-antitoxin system VapC family toxin [Devosiaceae bacterium]|jgi:hypothetical protein
MVIVDTNVIIDIATRDERWAAWSLSMRDAADLRGGAGINDIVFAELCVRYPTLEGVTELVNLLKLEMISMPPAALFLAAKAFERYRAAGGTRTNVLPDFFIGAQAAVLSMPLLTRDPKPYRNYFPGLELISP